MAVQANEMFSLSAETPNDAHLYGEVVVRGSAEARVSLRRGLDLSAGFDVRAEAKFAAVADIVRASFGAGVSVRGGLALQAAFPLDLFNEAGVVARLRAQIEAAAFVRASVSLELGAFKQLVADALPGTEFDELTGILFDEFWVEAGVWGRAAFAAEIFGEAYLTGSLLPSARGGPGFSCSVRYGVGFIYGTGFDFIANFGIKDAHRLTDRLASALAARALASAEAAINGMLPDQAAVARNALVPLRLVMPLAVRLPFQLGFELAKVVPAEQRGVAAGSALSTFARSALDIVLNAAAEMAMRELGRLLGLEAAVRGVLDLTDAERDQAGRILEESIEGLKRIAAIPIANMAAWLPELAGLIERLDAFIGLGVLQNGPTRELRHALALAWAAAELIGRLQAWMADENRRVVDLLDALPQVTPSGGAVPAYVAARIGKPVGGQLALTDMVEFLLQVDLDAEVRKVVPALGETLDWIADALGTPAEELLPQLFRGIAQSTGADAAAALARLAPAISDAVQQRIGPLLTQIKSSNPGNQALAIIVDELLAPSLVALPGVFLPQIANLGSPEAGIRFREALSSVALQTLVRFLVSATDALLAHGMRQGEVELARLGPEILRLGEQHPSYAMLATVASRAVIPGGITPREASELVVLGGKVLGVLKDAPREGIADAIRIVAALGLSTEDTRNANLGMLVSSDDVPSAQNLIGALDKVKDGLGDVATLAVPELLKIIALHPLREAEMVVLFVQEVAVKAIVALQQAVVWLAEQLEQLRQRLAQLLQDIVAAVARIAGLVENLANAVVGLVDDFVERVRLAGRDMVERLTGGLGPLQGAALGLYDMAFEAASALLTAPIRLIAEIAGWVRETLSSAVEGGSTSRQGIDEAVRFRIRSSNAASLRLEIKVTVGTPLGDVTLLDLGAINIGAGSILQMLEGIVLGDGNYQGITQRAATENSNRMALQSQADITSRTLQNALDQQAAQQQVGDLVPGGELRLEVIAPADGELGRPWVNLRVRISGINRTHLAPTLGVPRRVVMTLNGVEQDFSPDAWQQVRDEQGVVWFEYRARVIPFPEPRKMVADAGFKPHVLESTRVQIDPNVVAVLVPGEEGRVRFARASSLADLRISPEFVGEVTDSATATMWAAARDAFPERFAQGQVMHLPVKLSGQAEVTMEAGPCCHGTRPPLVLRDPRGVGAPLNRLDLFAPDIDREFGWLHRGRAGCNQLAVAVTDGRDQNRSAARVFFLGGEPR